MRKMQELVKQKETTPRNWAPLHYSSLYGCQGTKQRRALQQESTPKYLGWFRLLLWPSEVMR